MRKMIRLLFLAALFIMSLFSIMLMIFPFPGHVPVLMYHFVGSESDALNSKNFVSSKEFEEQMSFLKAFKYKVISVDDLYKIKKGEIKAKGREIAITFDDANYTFLDNAMPILEKYKFPVTVFAVSESVYGELHGSMTEATLIELQKTGFVDIQSHSATHPILSEVDSDQLKKELAGSKEAFEQMLQKPVEYFAYPSGRVNARVVEEVEKAGYKMAFTTSRKNTEGMEEGLYTLPRVKISRTSDHWFSFWVKISGIYSFFKSL